MRHQPTPAPTEDRVALRADDARGPAAPTPPTDRTAADARPAVTHTVAKGDTLMKLAVKYYKDQNKWRTIQQANKGVSVLQVGQKLTIPPPPDAPTKAADSTPKARGADAPAPDAPSLDKPAKPAPVTPAPAQGKTYTVQKGDTFMRIARNIYRDPGKWRQLYESNRAKLPDPAKPDSLRPGTIIQLPALASSR